MTIQNTFSFFKKALQKPITRIVISFFILLFLLSKLHLSDLWHSINQISLGLWVLSLIVFMAGHVVGVFKWRLLINTSNNKLPLSHAFPCYFAGLFANIFLPSLVGGDVVRAGLAIRFNKQKESVILGGLLDRFLDTSALALIVFGVTLFFPAALSTEDHKILFWVSMLLLGFVLCCIIFLVVPLPRSVPNLLSKIVVRFRNVIKHMAKNPKQILLGSGMALFIQILFILLFVFLGKVLGIHLSLPIWFIIWPIAKLSTTLPISMGGIGIREAALVVLLGRFAVSSSSSLGLGLIWESIFIASSGIGGIFYFLLNKSNTRQETQLLQ